MATDAKRYSFRFTADEIGVLDDVLYHADGLYDFGGEVDEPPYEEVVRRRLRERIGKRHDGITELALAAINTDTEG